MAYSESQKKATRKYNKKAYDRLYITVDKGRKEVIKAAADAQGMSVNEYVVNLIEKSLK